APATSGSPASSMRPVSGTPCARSTQRSSSTRTSSPLEEASMANESFDVTTGCDLQEVDNAVNQALREITGRFDFKNVLAEVEFDRAKNQINLHTTDEYKLDAIWDVLMGRLIARKVPTKNLKRHDLEQAGGNTVRQQVDLVQAIDSETAKKMSKFIRDL